MAQLSSAQLPATTDILIAGAGPAGLALAAELRRLNIDAVLIDNQAEGANTSRAAVVHARTLEVLEPLGVVPEMLARGLVVPIFRARNRDRALMEVDFRHLPTRYAFTLMCPQNLTEAILLARLGELGGAVLRPMRLAGLRADGDGVAAQIEDADGLHDVSAKWLVGCDGAHSTVRSAAAFPFEGGAYAEGFALADIRMDWPLGREEISLFLSPAGLMLVAPLPDDRFRIVATADGAPEKPDVAYMQRIVEARGPTLGEHRVREIVWSSRFHVQHKLVSAFRAGRVLLCGDAAHLHSPAGGQGMNTGIQDAISLAAPLIRAVKDGDDGALDGWAARRREIAKSVITMTDRMTRAATLKSRPAELLRNAAISLVGHIPGAADKVARRLAELDNR